jgi:outer membrane protein OmpA-like peptidoglycan-associated protein
MRTILYTIISLAIAIGANGQEKESSLLKTANAEFAQLRYSYAIPLYKKHLQSNKTDAKAALQLAKCYQINNQYDSAIKYTKQAITLGAVAGDILPELLANKGDYSAAIAAYANSNAAVASVRKSGFGKTTTLQNTPVNYTVNYLDINSPFNEYAAMPYKDGFIFESNRAQNIKGNNEFGWDGSAYSKIYFTTNKNILPFDSAKKMNWSEKSFSVAIADLAKETTNDVDKIDTRKYGFKKIAPFNQNGVVYLDEELQSKFNMGAICFSTDSTTAYFTKNQESSKNLFKSNVNQKYLLEIWSANVVNGKFINLIKLDFNKSNASYFHPALSKDGKRLYFISDQLGGKGGTDLYYVEKNAQGNWGSPFNSGDKVNTAANELYPTFADGELYISSNGHEGLGGLDIYKAKFQNENIIGVEHLGAPVNSSTDDMSYTKKGSSGYFVSNRYGSDDIFAYEAILKKVRLSGKVITSDGSKPNIKIQLYELKNNSLLETVALDANNSYSFLVSQNKSYSVVATTPNGDKSDLLAETNAYSYFSKELVKSLNDLVIQIPVITKTILEDKPTFNNIIDSLKAITSDYVQLHHQFDKTAIEKSDLSNYFKLINRVKATTNARIIVISAADCMGNAEYNEKLSSRRSDAITAQLRKSKKSNTYVSLHLGESVLVEACDIQYYNRKNQKSNRYTYVFIQE